jgi:hypothetical protein
MCHGRRLLGLLLVFVSASLQAQTSDDPPALELALSDETLQLRYDGPTNLMGTDSRAAYGLFLSESRDLVATGGVMVDSDLALGAFDLNFGPQAYAALLDEENEDVFALAIGVEVRLNIARDRGLAIAGHAFYSPDVLTFGSADNLRDFMVRAEIQLNERLLGFAGYRWFELDLLERQEQTLQNELFAGVRWRLR